MVLQAATRKDSVLLDEEEGLDDYLFEELNEVTLEDSILQKLFESFHSEEN